MYKFRYCLIIIIIFSLSRGIIAQANYADSTKLSRLTALYNDLDYNTIAFNDLKNKWVVTDPVYVREIFNRFVVKDALTMNGKLVSRKILEEKIQDIYNGDVFIELRRRYYDNQIEELRFFTESKLNTLKNVNVPKRDYFFDPITDYIYIRSILGDKIYNDLKSEFYAHTDLTKEAFGNKEAYNFDITLNLFDSDLMFWSQTTQAKNKYLVSFFTKWGDNQIVFPGWYYSDIFLGLKLAYISYVRNNEPYISYYLKLGSGVPIQNPTFEFKSDPYGPKLYHSGLNLFTELGGHPFSLVSHNLENLELKVNAMYSLTTYQTKKYNLNYTSQFFSNRSFFNLLFKYSDIINLMKFGWLYASVGYSNYNIVHYLYDPEVSTLQKIKDKNFKPSSNMITARIGIDNFNGLLVHDISPVVNYDLTNQYMYAGFKVKLMLSNIIGFEFRFYTSFGVSPTKLPFYRESSYIIFSPIIRINY